MRENGDLFAPQRGKPPEPPKGYCRDLKNPYIYHPIIHPCEYLVPFEEKYDCGRQINGVFCDRDEKIVTGGDCFKCQN